MIKPARLAALTVLSALAGCAWPTPRYLPVTPTDVELDCGDGYMVYQKDDIKSVQVIPYWATEARYAVCAGRERQPLQSRARKAAEQKLGPKCAITGESSPMPTVYEFTYSCKP